MAEVTENLWAKDIFVKKINTPIAFLKQQAKYLEEITQGVLIGDISISNTSIVSGSSLKDKSVVAIYMAIEAPFLNNYKTYLIKLHQDPTLIYPLEFYNLTNNNVHIINNETEFKQVISDFLGSESVSNLIGNLLSQSEVTV